MDPPRPKREVRDEQAAPAAAGGGGGGGLGGALQEQLIDFEDRRLQAAGFFLAWGSCMVLNGTVLNRPTAKPEHVFAGFLLCTLGTGIAILTIAGGGAGRAAGQIEGFLRRFF